MSKARAISATKAKAAAQPVRLRIRCLNPLNPRQHHARFGLQEKRPGDWILHEGTTAADGTLVFECDCEVKKVSDETAPDFAGRFIQGSRGERFLYLSWKPNGWSAGAPEPNQIAWVRRIKIHLSGITWAKVREAAKRGGFLETTIAGRGRDGGPACASVPLIGGWIVQA